VRDLAEAIGSRPPGSASEKAAADYLAEKLRSFGYEVELQPFPISNEASRTADLAVRGSESTSVTSVPFEGSAAGDVSGALVSVPGVGAPSDFPSNARGSVVVIERGQLQFREKIANAVAAGAIGVIIFNNEDGGFLGTLGGTSAIPAVSVSQAEGRRLLGLLAAGGATAELSVDPSRPGTSHNVVAKPPGRDCEVISGGHYDSVPQAPGANDNASGTATVLELAALTANRGLMGGNCFVLFGAEEIGLVGSRAYVESLPAAARSRLKAMLNFDMVGVGDQSWQLIGNAALQDRASGLAAGLNMPVTRSSSAGTGAGSDHASFIQAGIPALFLHRTQDTEWHQPGDRPIRVLPEHLETAARLGIALIESLAGGT
jgi:aminopeptidase YwaD